MKRVLLLLCLVTALGCSGLSSLLVQNLSGKSVEVTITADHTKDHGGPSAFSGSASPGEEVESISWFRDAPLNLSVETTFHDGRKLTNKWMPGIYPPGMQRGTSGGAYYILEIHDSELVLRDPNAYDRFRRNPQFEIFRYLPGCCAVCLIIFVGILYSQKKRAKT